jgi:hypothetical protein
MFQGYLTLLILAWICVFSSNAFLHPIKLRTISSTPSIRQSGSLLFAEKKDSKSKPTDESEYWPGEWVSLWTKEKIFASE